MATTAPGIKQLLDAEKFAADLVKQARNRTYFLAIASGLRHAVVVQLSWSCSCLGWCVVGKAMRLNQARTEAELEVKAFKAELEQQMKDKDSENKSAGGADLIAIEERMKQDLAALAENVNTNTDKVIHLIF